MQTTPTPELTQFAEDVLTGLSSTPKALSSKYFYDDEGSRLFREIMKLPEYYLTGCEEDIFSTQTSEIFKAFSGRNENVNERVSPSSETRSLTLAFPPAAFDLIELGAGDGTKTAILVVYFLSEGGDIFY
jgi:uncharacterized SAM-dependent methyltransferase